MATNAQNLINSAYSGGFFKFSERSINEMATYAACVVIGGSCSAATLIALAKADGMDRLSEFDLSATALYSACSGGGGCTAQSQINNSQASGYSKLPERHILEAILFSVS